MATTFRKTHGDIAEILKTMIRSREFSGSLGSGFKDPVGYTLSAVRLAYGDRLVTNPQPLVGWIRQMGEGLYDHETPDGYDLSSAAWSAPGQMATRFDIARQLGNGAARLFQLADAPPGTPPPACPGAGAEGLARPRRADTLARQAHARRARTGALPGGMERAVFLLARIHAPIGGSHDAFPYPSP